MNVILHNGEAIALCTERRSLAALNFLILKELLSEGKRVLFFAVEKPHHYMSHLLGINGVKQRAVTYVDIRSPEAADIAFPIPVGGHRGVRIGGFVFRDMILLDDYDAVIVDDIDFLNHMWSEDTIKKFITSMVKEAHSSKVPLIFPIKNSNRVRGLLEGIVDKIACDEEVMQ